MPRDTSTLGKSLALTVSGRYNRTPIDNIDRLPPARAGLARVPQRAIRVRALQSGRRPHLQPSRVRQRLLQLQRSQPRAHGHRTGLRRSERAVQSAERAGQRSSAQAGGDPDFEAGVRGTLENNLRWSAGWFRGENYNDLLFVASEQTGFGYFTNFGQTRRQGAEDELSARIGNSPWAAITPFWPRPIRARRPSTAEATAPTTAARGWTATSRFSRATASRRSRAIF